MANIEIRVSRELALVARALKAEGDRSLANALRRGLRKSAKPIVEAAQLAAREQLPRRKGLNESIAAEKYSIRTNLGAAHPTVRIVSRKGHAMKAIDDGVVRHPVFGHRDRWVPQRVTPHVITDAMRGEAPEVREHLLAEIEEWARRLT